MRETRWPPARGRAGILIDGPRLQVRALDGLCQTLISGDLEAAVAALAPGAPTLGLYALLPAGAHALCIGRMSALLVTPTAIAAPEGWRDGWCATSVDDGWTAVEVSGADAPQALMQATSADLAAGSPRPPSSSLACAPCWRGRKRASGCMSRRRGWRRCSPGSTASKAYCSLVESRRPLVLRSAGGASRRTLQEALPLGAYWIALRHGGLRRRLRTRSRGAKRAHPMATRGSRKTQSPGLRL